MLFKIRKAIDGLNHPGINTNLQSLVKNSIPYFLSTEMNVPNPLTIYWSINSVCNLRCKMCDVGTFNETGIFFKTLRIDRKLHEITLDKFKSVVDEFKLFKNKPNFAINSTEPLMYPNISEAIDYCSKNNITTSITTGGYFLPKHAKNLANARLTQLNISIDGPKDVHNKIRGRNDLFDNIIDGLKIYDEECKKINHKRKIFLNYTTTNLNYHCIEDFVKFFSNYSIDQIGISFMWFLSPDIVEKHNQIYNDDYPVSVSCYDDHVNPNKADIDILYDQIQKVKKYKNVKILGPDTKMDLKKFFHNPNELMQKNANCMASWFFTQVLADGNVIVHTRCHTKSLGNINEEKILDIWNGNKMKKWRKFIKNKKLMPMCARCDLSY